MTFPQQPNANINTLVSKLATNIDQRVVATYRESSQRLYGIPRNRGLTMNIPLIGDTVTAIPGWIHSIIVFHTCRIVAWEIFALVSGTISIDLRLSSIPTSPSVAPTLTSMNGASHFLALNGYTVVDTDTTKWTNRDILAGQVLSVYINSVSGMQQAVLGLQMLDLHGKVLQT